MANLAGRLKKIERGITDNTPPEPRPILVAKSQEEADAFAALHRGKPYLIIRVTCASLQCDGCSDKGCYSCRHKQGVHDAGK